MWRTNAMRMGKKGILKTGRALRRTDTARCWMGDDSYEFDGKVKGCCRLWLVILHVLV